jgi:hypothetical protein
MEYSVEVGSGAMMYMPSFVRTGSGIYWGGYTDAQHHDLISQLLFFSK